jgi:hypothetical protein
MSSVRPLSGIIVIEIGHGVAAPYAGMILGELGAEVIKVENPRGGDACPGCGPPFGEARTAARRAQPRDRRSGPMTRHRRSVLAAALLGLALAACAQKPPPRPATHPSSGPDTVVSASDDPNSRFIGLIGTRVQHAPPFLGVPETNFYCLRSFIDQQTGETRHQLYVADSYSGAERHWDAARDGAGHALRFVEISRDQITCDGGCSYAEEFAADIPEGELRANSQGLKVIFGTSSGAEKTIIVSGNQITSQIAAIDARQHAPSSASKAP